MMFGFVCTGIETRVNDGLTAVIPYLGSFNLECRHNYLGSGSALWTFLYHDKFKWYKGNRAIYSYTYEDVRFANAWKIKQLDNNLKINFFTNSYPSPVIQIKGVTSQHKGNYKCDFTSLGKVTQPTTTVEIQIAGKSLCQSLCQSLSSLSVTLSFVIF